MVAAGSAPRRAAIACRLIAVVCLGLGFAEAHGWRWSLLVTGAGLLVASLAWRPKASRVAGARWSGSADLIDGRTRWPGQLSFTADAVVWIPSGSSMRRGREQLRVPVGEGGSVAFGAGTALLDVAIEVRADDGRSYSFMTHRSARLRRAVGVVEP